jgi:glucose-1-phosphate thymidylyltransferase
MKALILAAGYATRLYPLTKEFPKPLLLVSSRPIIDYIIDKLVAIDDIDEIIVVTNSKFIPRFKKWSGSLKIGKRLSLIDDLTKKYADRRGAIGDMDFAINKKRIKDELLVIGGDNLFDGGIEGFLAFARSRRHYPAIGVYDINGTREAKKYGVVRLDGKSRVIDFQEKPAKPKSTLVAMCLYYFPKDKLNFIKEYLRSKTDKHDATGYYIDWLRKKAPVFGFIFGGRWYDIGDHKFYSEARNEFSKR